MKFALHKGRPGNYTHCSPGSFELSDGDRELARGRVKMMGWVDEEGRDEGDKQK